MGDEQQDESQNMDVVDVEKNVAAECSETIAEAPLPTRMDIFYDLNGSLGFAVGSSGFIFAMYFSNWLPYFRYGSLAWIWGCVMYSIPLLLKLNGHHGGCSKDYNNDSPCMSPWGIGEFGEFFCYLFYIVGCVLGGFFDEESVEKFLPAINHMFVYGSFSLALEPVYQVVLFVRRNGSCASRLRETKLCGSSSPSPSSSSSSSSTNVDDTDTSRSSNNGKRAGLALSPPLKLHWDRFFELCAMTFFCAAGVFGGFPPHPSLALPGVYFWEVGSLFSVARSILMVHKRNQGLNALQNSTKATKSSPRQYNAINNKMENS